MTLNARERKSKRNYQNKTRTLRQALKDVFLVECPCKHFDQDSPFRIWVDIDDQKHADTCFKVIVAKALKIKVTTCQ